jgi:3-phenylpropionate/trans-cinnamate dioxygenase ferredoxin reductase subunit/phthalate 3,4-dioxygenase ferredoxin reductase subunit
VTGHVVIVGASVAGVRVARTLRDEGWAGPITLLEAEQHMPYDKPPLSKAGLLSADDVPSLLTADDVGALDLDLRLGARAAALDPATGTVTLADGEVVGYDALVLATGAAARPSPWCAGSPRVHVMRSRDDAQALRTMLAPGNRLLIIGAGFIGSEVAGSARSQGVEVTLVDPQPVPMARIMGEAVARRFVDLHRDHGVDVRLGVGVEQIDDRGEHVVATLTDGAQVEVDAVLVGIGVSLNTAWLGSSGLPMDNGVLCDAQCRVIGSSNIYAAGDVSRWRHERHGRDVRVEHWTNAIEQAAVVAHNIAHPHDLRTHAPVEYVWSDQYDWKIQIVGTPAPGIEPVVLEPAGTGRFAAIYADADNALCGSVTINWGRASVLVRKALRDHGSVEDVLRTLSPQVVS